MAAKVSGEASRKRIYPNICLEGGLVETETERKRKWKWKKRSLLFIASWLWSSLYLSDIEIADRVLQLCIEF